MKRYDIPHFPSELLDCFEDIDARLKALETMAGNHIPRIDPSFGVPVTQSPFPPNTNLVPKFVSVGPQPGQPASPAELVARAAPVKGEPGWYWVKWEILGNWMFGNLGADRHWRTTMLGYRDAPAIIGQRIPDPEE